MSSSNIFRLCAVLMVLASSLLAGCVRRTLTITTEPPNARVYLNDEEVGRSKVTTDFLWYGDYRVTLRAQGYQTLETGWQIDPPWYQIVPIDFVAEVLWPGQLHDTHERHFTMVEAQEPTSEELLSRADDLRRRAMDARK
jgi:PEGA domain